MNQHQRDYLDFPGGVDEKIPPQPQVTLINIDGKNDCCQSQVGDERIFPLHMRMGPLGNLKLSSFRRGWLVSSCFFSGWGRLTKG